MVRQENLWGKSDAGNPHVRFDEEEVAPAVTPRRGSLLYRRVCVVAAMAALSVVTSVGAEYYVNPDPMVGSNDYDGTSPTNVPGTLQGPKLTLTAVMSGRTDGDVVLAAEGTYASGESGVYRVEVPAGVTLKAAGLRDNTFIVGASAENVLVDEAPWGCGNGAEQCVHLYQRAKLVGFTVCGGRGSAWDDNKYGAGVSGEGQNGDNASIVVDCVISNCVAGRGAGVRNASAVRCRFAGNRVKKMGSHIWNVDAYNCYLGASASSGQYDASGARLFNCHVVGSAYGCSVYSSYVAYDKGGNSFFHSIWSSPNSLASGSTKDEPTVRSWSVDLDSDLRPVKGSHYGIDKGSLANCAELSPAVNMDFLSTDYAGGQRVYNGTIDIGCGEYDTRGDVAAAIADSSGISVTELPSDAVVTSGALSLTAGSSMAVEWSESDVQPHIYAFTVTAGEGATVLVYLDGASEPAWTIAGEERRVSHSAVGGAAYRFEVAGGDAEISGVTRGRDYYVDAGAEDDSCDGTSPVRGEGSVGPKKFLQSAVALVSADHGDVIHVAEGVYDSGSYDIYRFYLNKAGVTVKASGDRHRTFIVGKDGTGSSYGCGDGALICAYLYERCRLEGFTICGGRATLFDKSKYGAGVRGANDGSSMVVDCVISNCVSGRGAGCYAATAVRCEFSNNRVSTTGTDLMNAKGYNCYFHGSLSPTKYDVYMASLYNCTTDDSGTLLDTTAYNSRFGKDHGKGSYHCCAYKSVAAVTSEADVSEFDGDCYQSSTFSWDADVRPSSSSGIDVNRGKWALYEGGSSGADIECLSSDFRGGQRIYDGEIDVGCGEYDWRGDFSQRVGRGGRIVVRAAGPGVTSPSERALSLGVGDELLLEWTLSGDTVRTFAVDGSATVSVDGVEVPVVGGVCSFAAAAGVHTVRIVQTGGASVAVSDFRSNNGMAVIIR